MNRKIASAICVAMSFLLFGSQANGDIVFTVTQRTPGQIALGDTALFDVRLSITPDMATINNLAGVTFSIGADDPGITGTSTSGGIFTSATNDTASALSGGRTYLFTPLEGGFIGGAGSANLFSASAGPRTLDTAGGYLGTLQLSTAGATVGNYFMTLGDLDAINDASQNLATLLGTNFVGAPLAYEIVNPPPPVVPEPTSVALVGIAGVAFVVRKLRRKSSSLSS